MTDLDRSTADRLLAGTLAPDDAPPAYRGVAEIVAALRAPAADDPAGAAEAAARIAPVVAASAAPTGRSPLASNRSSRRSTPRRAALLAATVGGLLLVGGLAAAGALPGVSSGTPPVTTPVPNSNAGEHPNTAGTSADHVPSSVPPVTNATPPSSSPPSGTKGAEIVPIAHDPNLQGLDKGAAVSGAASGGTSQAGADHGPPTSLSAPPSLPPQVTPPSQAGPGLTHRPGP